MKRILRFLEWLVEPGYGWPPPILLALFAVAAAALACDGFRCELHVTSTPTQQGAPR